MTLLNSHIQEIFKVIQNIFILSLGWISLASGQDLVDHWIAKLVFIDDTSSDKSMLNVLLCADSACKVWQN